MSEPIDGVTRSGIPYRRGGGPSIFGGLTVAWDVLPDCPACGKPTGEKCFMVIGDKECTKITPHRERLPEVNVVGDALEPDEEAATVDASGPTPPGEGLRTGTGGPDAPGASEGLDATDWDAVDAIADRFRRIIFDEAATFEHIFPSGIRGDVVGVPDAARVIARNVLGYPLIRQAIAEQIAAEIERNARLWEDYGQHPDGIAGARRAASIAREVGRG